MYFIYLVRKTHNLFLNDAYFWPYLSTILYYSIMFMIDHENRKLDLLTYEYGQRMVNEA